MRVLVVGDRSVPAGYYVDGLAVPGEIVDAAADTEVPAVRCAPVLRAAPQLRAVCVARARLENAAVTMHCAGDTTHTTSRSTRLVAEAVARLTATGRCAAAVRAREQGQV